MSFKIGVIILFVIIFFLELISVGLLMTAAARLDAKIRTMTIIVREICRDVNDYNSILCTMHKTMKEHQKKQTDDDHNCII